MDSFSADWLTLREPADTRARAAHLAQALAGALPRGRAIRALDLAAGTGSNVRYLAGHLPSPQEWLLVDHDASLLAAARARLSMPVATRAADLSRLEDHLDIFADRDLVTASALLDLVSERWLDLLVRTCRDVNAAVLFALSYDGRMECRPEEPGDARIRELVNEHQRTDKGFGAALGPSAAPVCARLLREQGYDVQRTRSDWVLGPDEQELQRQLVDGWVAAATAMAPADAESVARWRDRRMAHVLQARSHLVVGHEDVAGWRVR